MFNKKKTGKAVSEACVSINADLLQAELNKDLLPKFLEYDPYFFGYLRGTFAIAYLEIYEKQLSNRLAYLGAIELFKVYFPKASKKSIKKILSNEMRLFSEGEGMSNAMSDYTPRAFGSNETSLTEYLKEVIPLHSELGQV